MTRCAPNKRLSQSRCHFWPSLNVSVTRPQAWQQTQAGAVSVLQVPWRWLQCPHPSPDMLLKQSLWTAFAATVVSRQPRPAAHTFSAAGGCAAGARSCGAPPQCVHHHTALAGAAHAPAVGSHDRGNAPHPEDLQGIDALQANLSGRLPAPTFKAHLQHHHQSQSVASSLRKTIASARKIIAISTQGHWCLAIHMSSASLQHHHRSQSLQAA